MHTHSGFARPYQRSRGAFSTVRVGNQISLPSMRGVSMASPGAAPRHRTTSSGVLSARLPGWFSWCRPPGLGWYGTVMSCDVRRVGGTAALEGAFPPARPIPASRAFSGEGCRRPARRCARRCRGPPARLGHIGARHLGAGRSYPNRCRCRLWRCELFPSSCGRDLMRAVPHRLRCLRCAATPSSTCPRRGRQALAPS